MEKCMYYKILEEIRDLKSLIHGKLSERWLTITDVTQYTALSESTIRRAVRKGELKCSKRTGKLIFKKSNVERWLNG